MPRRQTDSSKSTILVLLRDRKGLEEARLVLRKQKHPFVLIPAIKIDLKKFKFKFNSYDFGLITSAHAVDSLVKNLNQKKLKLSDLPIQSWIAIGKRSAARLRAAGILKPHVLEDGNSNGLRNFFRKYSNSTIFYPRSSRADEENMNFLRASGRKLDAPIAYSNMTLSIRSQLKKLFAREQNLVFILMSPSGVLALKKSSNRNELKNFINIWIAIGPTTAIEIQKLGFKASIAPRSELKSVINFSIEKAHKISR